MDQLEYQHMVQLLLWLSFPLPMLLRLLSLLPLPHTNTLFHPTLCSTLVEHEAQNLKSPLLLLPDFPLLPYPMDPTLPWPLEMLLELMRNPKKPNRLSTLVQSL